MNYRHIYHAGNFADVVKHVALMLVLEYMAEKDKPFFVLDTHAGIGLYDLESEQARKTAEADDGIARLWDAPDLPPALARYVGMVRDMNMGALRYYPGSPLIAQALLREGDSLVVNELHPEDVETLTRNIGRDKRVRVEHRDAYESWRALLPPPQRRGVVIVDPPFEVRDEFTLLTRGLRDAHKRWAGGTTILWYPIKDPAHVAAFHADLRMLGIPDMVALDFYRQKPDDVTKLNGSGLILVNPPWTLRAQLDEIMPVLVDKLTGGRGSFSFSVISGE
jgi:23S rRNA (adenine2030-N6)-methyltransferase